jgi:hypothetical protein
MSKNQRNALLRITPTAGRRIIQTPEWRSLMAEALREPFAETKGKVPITHSPISEFTERPKFLSFDEFVTDVRRAYEEVGMPGDVQKWYRNEYKKRTGWPSAPQVTYRNKGWSGYATVTGKERIGFLRYTDFANIVKRAYKEAGSPEGVFDWYQNVCSEHPEWPTNPHRSYVTEWEGYPALVGKEVVKLLEFSQFKEEVRAAYLEAKSPKNVYDLYCSIQTQYPRWPTTPQTTYKNKGWEGYPELVGKEVVKLLEFSQFKEEVRAAYQATGVAIINVIKWYQQEYKKHPGWPVSPQLTYRNKGWKGYPVLVEKLEHLEFSTFTEQIRIAYAEAGSPINISKWYQQEYKKHPGWPAQPYVKYKNSGWKSYPELVGK